MTDTTPRYVGIDLASAESHSAFISFDEAGYIPHASIEALMRHIKRQRAKHFGWMNWFINRGHISTQEDPRQLRKWLRQRSNRRVF